MSVSSDHFPQRPSRASTQPPVARDISSRANVESDLENVYRSVASQTFVPLPHTGDEIAACKKHLEPWARILEGSDATEAKLRGRSGRYLFVHIASHAVAEEDSLFSFVALSPPESANRSVDNDGLLCVYEIPNLDLDGCAMVVLSACETNIGGPLSLEVDNSLTRAFLIGGSKRVISSEWPVADKATAELMGHFYEKLAMYRRENDPLAYAKALRDARLQVMDNASPFYWAPFVLVGPGGDGETLDLSR